MGLNFTLKFPEYFQQRISKLYPFDLVITYQYIDVYFK